jgi:alpha-tubulin suppressor-like RCC1 family protein
MFASFLVAGLNSKKYFITNQFTSRNRRGPALVNTNTDDKLEWTQIACGGMHTTGLTKKGEVFTWGNNCFGQLGHGNKEDREIPTKIASLDGIVIIKISCGADHTAALTDKGEIFTWYARS